MACELFDCPLESVVFGDVDCAAGGSVEGWTFHVLWHWHEDVDVVGDALLLVVALHLYDESDAGVGG